MNLPDNEEILIRRFLLGEVSDQEREQVERELMTRSKYFDRVFKTEESLIDEYVKGTLSEHERRRFETYFLRAPERRAKLAFAESLNRYIAESKTLKSADVLGARGEAARSMNGVPWFRRIPRRALIALPLIAALVLAAGAIILLRDNARLREQVLQRGPDQNQADNELHEQLGEQTRRNEELARQIEALQSERSRIEQELARLKQEAGRQRESTSPATASLIIAPGLVRDKGRTNRVRLKSDVQRLRLELKVEEANSGGYRAEVQTVEGKSVWRVDNLRARRRAGENIVVATLPAGHLPEGDYLLSLSAAMPGGGYEEVATYSFTVLRD